MKDNNTGKTVGFYERGQAIFDRIPKEEKKMKISTAEIDTMAKSEVAAEKAKKALLEVYDE